MTNFVPYGLSQDHQKLIMTCVNRLLPPDAKVFVFGSRAVPQKAKRYSDLDLWIETTSPLSGDLLLALHEELRASDLPIKVDIVTPETCLPEYLESINRQKIFWF